MEAEREKKLCLECVDSGDCGRNVMCNCWKIFNGKLFFRHFYVRHESLEMLVLVFSVD